MKNYDVQIKIKITNIRTSFGITTFLGTIISKLSLDLFRAYILNCIIPAVQYGIGFLWALNPNYYEVPAGTVMELVM